MTRYRTREDVERCRQIHREFGTTYYYATVRFPQEIKWRVHGLYAFVRVPDEWVDNPESLSLAQQRQKLEGWREQLTLGLAGHRPEHPAMRVFCDLIHECQVPIAEAHCFLDAMLMDLNQDRYQTFEDLRSYMRGSASAIGVMMCYAMGVEIQAETLERAKALGEAMQLTNFLRDIREDFERGRIYLPQADLDRFAVTECDIRNHRVNENFRALMKFEIARARELYAISDLGIRQLPREVRKAVLLARLLYSQILDQIEAQDYDVFAQRARTNLPQKAACASRVFLSSDRILDHLIHGGLTA